MRVEDGFQPTAYHEDHPYVADPVLPDLLRRILPPDVLAEVHSDLVRFGGEVETTIREISKLADLPQFTQFDQWGRRVDALHTSEGWRKLKQVAQTEGIPGISYERKYGEHSRVWAFAKVLVMTGDSQMIFCPISMTDGCARVLELFGTPGMKRDVFSRLISRDPSVAFTSGQWMTERSGGSDVSLTETVAIPTNTSNSFGSRYKLDGFKWFSSATDSEVAVALARTGPLERGSRSLSLFLVPLRLPLIRDASSPLPSSTSNGIFVHRLKNKIGTHALPTAELSLTSTDGFLVGSLNEGVKTITPVLNITRVYSAFASIGNLRKCLAIASAYAKIRAIKSGTELLATNPIHVAQLASISLVYRGLTHFTFGVVRLLGKVECRVATEDEQRRLRMLTSVVKAFASEKSCSAMEEAMVSLGGAGYMEENDIGRLIRDALVEKIWEGTATVLSVDFIKAVRDPKTWSAFVTWGTEVISSCSTELRNKILSPLSTLEKAVKQLSAIFSVPQAPLLPRPACFLTAHIATALYLLEHAIWAHERGQGQADIEVFGRWVEEGGLVGAMVDVDRAKGYGQARLELNSAIVYPQPIAKL